MHSILSINGVYLRSDSPNLSSFTLFNIAPALWIVRYGNCYFVNASSTSPLILVYRNIDPLSAPIEVNRE